MEQNTMQKIKVTNNLSNAAKNIVDNSLKIKKNEEVAIIVDEDKLDLANALVKEIKNIGAPLTVITVLSGMRAGKHAVKFTEVIESGLLSSNVIITLIEKHDKEGKFRKSIIDLCKVSNVRIAHLPGINRKYFEECLVLDFHETDKISEELLEIYYLARNKKFIVNSPGGTNISFSSDIFDSSSGVIDTPYTWDNLPSGEVYLVPLQEETNGQIICDVSMPKIDLIKENSVIEFNLEKGKIIDYNIRGNKNNKFAFLDEMLVKEGMDVIAEFGIGLNDRIKAPVGLILIDEKIYGTAHFAFGDSTEIGGSHDAEAHWDFVFDKPTIELDRKIIMEKGIFKYDLKDWRFSFEYHPEIKFNEKSSFTRKSAAIIDIIDNKLFLFWKGEGGKGKTHSLQVGDEEVSQLSAMLMNCLKFQKKSLPELSAQLQLDQDKTKILLAILHELKIIDPVG